MRDKQYKGNRTPKQAAEGIKVAIENAASLLTDAKLLFDNGRYERSVALSVLAIEEASKISIIRSILLENDPVELKKSWQEYRRHTDKTLSWILPDMYLIHFKISKSDWAKVKDLYPEMGTYLKDVKLE